MKLSANHVQVLRDIRAARYQYQPASSKTLRMLERRGLCESTSMGWRLTVFGVETLDKIANARLPGSEDEVT